MDRENIIVIGEIVGAHGIRGVVKVRSYAESPDIFNSGNPIWLGDADGGKEALDVLWVNTHHNKLLMALAGVTDRNEAEALAGKLLYIEKKALPALEDGTYYWFDLIGLAVYTVTGEYLGQLHSVMETGSNDVLVVKNTEKTPSSEVLIPVLDAVVDVVDLKKKLLRVNLPEGL